MSWTAAEREVLLRWPDEWAAQDPAFTLKDDYGLAQLRADLDALAAEEREVEMRRATLKAVKKARPVDEAALNAAQWYAILAGELRQSRIRSLRARRKAYEKARARND